MTFLNKYNDPELISAKIRRGDHRVAVGGMWNKIGRLQFEYVRDHGLARDMRFLDVGCGCLRGGLHFVDYLEARHYYGIDLSQDLLDVGYDVEILNAGLQQKLPRDNLYCTDNFDASRFEIDFDMALALSVFTHLPSNYMKLCLTRLSEVMKPGGIFFATVFISPDNHDWNQALQHTPGDITTFPDRDPFHYRADHAKSCCLGLPWKLENLESWNHPRDQWMATFVRTEGPA